MGMNDFQIGLIASLDGTKSRQQLNQDIETLKKQLGNVEIQAKLGKDAVSNLTKQLNATQISLQNVFIDKAAINRMVSQINTALSGININLGNNINGNNVIQNAQRTGQQIGQQLQNGISSVVQKNSFEKIFRASLSGLNNVSKDAENYFKTLSNIVSVQEKLGENNNLTSFIVSLKNADGVVEQLHYKLQTLKDDQGNITDRWFQYSGGSINDNGVVQQINTITSKADTLQLKLEKLKASYEDLNGAKPIKQQTHINDLNNQYNRVIATIDKLRNADESSMNSIISNANKEISTLEIMISKFQNAEYVATSLRTKDIGTIKIDETNKLDAFVEKMKQSGHYTDELKADVSTLRNTLNSVFDPNSLTDYLNKMSNLESKFKAVDAQAKTTEKNTKLQTNIESEKKQLQVYVNELKKAGVMSGEVKDKIQQMFSSLSKVNTQVGLTTWRAELKGVKAETDEVLKSVQKLSSTSIPQAKYTKLLNGGYDYDLNKLVSDFQKINAYSDETQSKITSLKTTLANMQNMSGSELVSTFNNFETEVGKLKVQLDQAKLSYDKFAQPVSDEKVTSLLLKIQDFLNKNTSITKEARTQLELYMKELSNGNVALSRWNQINQSLKETESHMRGLGRLGLAFKDQWKQAVSSFSTWLSASTAVMKVISETREAISELKDVNTYITEISKTNWDLNKNDLSQIAKSSFDIASKYGKSATNYLSGVQDMSRAGYKNAESMAELSVAAQGAGDMTDEIANKMIIATDKAYKLNGSIEELTKIMDGVNWVCDNNATNMSELSEGMSIVGSTAASTGVDVDELTAALGTMAATTQQSGSEVARAFKAILLNIKQVSDEEEGIDAEGLTKYEKACNALGVSLKETKDGILQTRDAMEVLEGLSESYNKLDPNDIKRVDLLNSVGGKLRATQLDALLTHFEDTYKPMLEQFINGQGTMEKEAEKTSKSWEGSLNRFKNTWTSTIDNIANSDAIINSINSLNNLLSIVNKLTDALGSFGSIGLGIGLIQSINGRGKRTIMFQW